MTAGEDPDRTAKAAIRDAATALFADRGPEAVTVRQIAAAVGVSPALVVHHYGSKDGLRGAVEAHAARTFEEVIEQLGSDDLAAALSGGSTASLAQAFAAAFPPGSPVPAYLRRSLLVGDAAGDRVFAGWFELTERLLVDLEAAGVARPSGDRRVRAAFLLVNDLAAVLLARQIGEVCGLDLLTPDGMTRWAAEAADVYAHGAFQAPDEGSTHA
ncbi:TetR/AcrR family transcriptional regulator [Nocardioides sp. GY 10113]|uniref:TetR/AcrR family transcriptional regulator n=1 Tax=Nocardioides sp. GY 10113 TaxID=2569761 RepID=UPI0010A8A45F|nr:TetR/AcrR family transcriptional regulator [Nocardioides sp. GY 10113]TIC87844.1 TetR/AcrR family transcriptional regulator [Nocardioides sp. GY 10113]